MGGRASKNAVSIRVDTMRDGAEGWNVKNLECMKSASSEHGLNFYVRESTLAVHSCGSVPQLLDGIQFELIDRAREESSDVKKLHIPDYRKIRIRV